MRDWVGLVLAGGSRAVAGGAAGAGGLALGAGEAAGALGSGALASPVIGGGTTLTPAINAAAAGNGLAGSTSLAGGQAGFQPSLTYQAAMGNPTYGSAPMRGMKPIQKSAMDGVMKSNQGLFGNFDMDKMKEMAGQMGGGGGGLPQNQQPQLMPPHLAPRPGLPFQPFAFSRGNYNFRRPIGF